MPRPRPLFPMLPLLALAAAPAAAQQPDSADARDTVRLATVVVTASRTPVRAADVGVAVTVVDARLETDPPALAMDVLRGLPGAHVDEAAGSGGPAIVRLRGGEEVYTQVLMDGVQVNENGGFFDFQGVPLGNVERVEVAHGPQGALYGSSAMSGVVHFVTRAGRAGPPRVRLSTEGGGAEGGGAYRGTADVSGGTPRLRWSAGAGTTYGRGHLRLPHDVRGTEASLRVDADPSARWSATGTVRWIGVDGRLPARDPGVTRVPLDPNARYERDRLVASAGTRLRAGGGWSHGVRASAFRQRFEYADRQDGVPAQDFFVFDADFRMESTLLRTTAEYLAGWERGALAVDAGALWEREDLETTTAGDFGDGRQALDRASGAVFGEVRAALPGGVRVMAGARAERYEGLETEVTPRASIVVPLVPGRLSLRAAAARGYKAPNLQEQYLENPFIAGNPDLAPENSASWEMGMDARTPDGAAEGGITVFRQDFRDLIRTVPLEGTEKQINRNLGRSRAAGVEWTARWTPAAGWALGTDGAWVRTEVRENIGLDPAAFPVGQALPGRPEVTGSAFVQAAPAARTGVILRGTWVGAQTVLSERFSGSRVEVDPYWLAAVTAHWHASVRTTLYVRVDNLLNRGYETSFDHPGAPRTVYAGLRFDGGGAR